MLQKRTNILFDQQSWEALAILAQAKNKSVGYLIRQAVEKTYFSKARQLKAEQAFNNIFSLRKKTKTKVNYRELIEDGRRY